MSKAGHLVTVPREYLEMLEKFHEENDIRKENIIGIISKEYPTGSLLLLRENKLTGNSDIRGICVIDSDGRELMKFKRF